MIWSASGRLQLFWDSPIIAGSVFASLAAYGVIFLRTRPATPPGCNRWVLATLWKLLFLVACLLTQSRGPLLALVTADLLGILSCRRFGLKRMAACWYAATALMAVACLLLPGGFGNRIAGAVTASDGSVLNRLVVWKSSLHALFVNPLTGLGGGEAGHHFSQWYQPDTLTYRYTGVFNEFLQLGIERGLIVLALALGAAAWFLSFPFLPFRSPENPAKGNLADRTALAAWLSGLTLLIAGQFSILHESGTLVSVALLNLTVLCGYQVIHRKHCLSAAKLARPALCSVAFAAACMTGAWIGRRHWSPSTDVLRPKNNVICLRKPQATPVAGRTATVFVDVEYLGPLYGGELRRWLSASEKFDELHVVDPRRPLERDDLNRCPTLVLTGRTVRFLGLIDPNRVSHVVLLHPSAAELDLPEINTRLTAVVPSSSEDGPPRFTGRKVELVDSGARSQSLEGVPMTFPHAPL